MAVLSNRAASLCHQKVEEDNQSCLAAWLFVIIKGGHSLSVANLLHFFPVCSMQRETSWSYYVQPAGRASPQPYRVESSGVRKQFQLSISEAAAS